MCVKLGSVYVCNRHLTTQTQQADKEKRQTRRSVVLTASSLSYCDNLFNVVFSAEPHYVAAHVC